jgi:hypothetical protein
MHRLGIHPGEEQCVVADMLAALPLFSKGGSRAVNGIGSKQHFAYLAHGIARGVANAIDVFGTAEFGKEVGDVA